LWELETPRGGVKRRAAPAAVLDVGGGRELLIVNTDQEPSL
jgi:hypothetical protein